MFSGCGGGAKLLQIKPASDNTTALVIRANTEMQGPVGDPQYYATNNVILKNNDSGEIIYGYNINRPYLIYTNIPAGTYHVDSFEQVGMGRDRTDLIKAEGDKIIFSITGGEVKYGGSYQLNVKYSLMGKPKEPVFTRLSEEEEEDIQDFLTTYRETIEEGKKKPEFADRVDIFEKKLK